MNQQHAFYGCIPALMTPCSESGTPDFNALVRKGKELIGQGMSSADYCGSMEAWPLLSEEQRQQGVAAVVDGSVPVIVVSGAQTTQKAED